MKSTAKAARNNATSDLNDESWMHHRPSVAEVYQCILELSCIRRCHYGAMRFIRTRGHHDVFSYLTRRGKLVKCVIMHNSRDEEMLSSLQRLPGSDAGIHVSLRAFSFPLSPPLPSRYSVSSVVFLLRQCLILRASLLVGVRGPVHRELSRRTTRGESRYLLYGLTGR